MRQKDEGPLEHADQRQAVEELHLFAVCNRALQCFEVREQMLKQKSANGNDTEQRVQLVPDEAGALTRAQRLRAASDNMHRGGHGGLNGCHGDFGS